ncbi:lysine-specific demethylase 4A [Ambystoma mexicanum]|uniref:lysine-specific demethylase 4A n=1 Tax=Ambystoma mexicanum TaxID=8296 RepID=UPI0037E7C831
MSRMASDPENPNPGSRIMTFHPTMEEFRNFSRYVAYIESQGAHRAGLAKVVPPKEWKPRLSYDDIDDLVIPAPIQQLVTGQSGLFTQYNIQKKPMSLREFRRTANSDKYCTPRYSDFEDLERKYWKNLTFNPPIYGADVNGSLYDKHVHEWNIGHLNTILDVVESEKGITIEGVNTPYLYFGMWKTSFAWHTEDMDLYSINYLHFGEPKSWYAIPPEHGKRLERLAKGFFPGSAQNCEAFLRHKMTLISPFILKKYGIPFSKVTQEAGEFMITFPYGYHAGFNHGFNCAESTNFATLRWIEYGKHSVLCSCRKDMVKISMDVFVRKFQPERYKLWLAGKDTAAIDHTLPTPEAAEFHKGECKEECEDDEEIEEKTLQLDTVKSKSVPKQRIGTKRHRVCLEVPEEVSTSECFPKEELSTSQYETDLPPVENPVLEVTPSSTTIEQQHEETLVAPDSTASTQGTFQELRSVKLEEEEEEEADVIQPCFKAEDEALDLSFPSSRVLSTAGGSILPHSSSQSSSSSLASSSPSDSDSSDSEAADLDLRRTLSPGEIRAADRDNEDDGSDADGSSSSSSSSSEDSPVKEDESSVSSTTTDQEFGEVSREPAASMQNSRLPLGPQTTGFKRCRTCPLQFPEADPHNLCLQCLGPDHPWPDCALCDSLSVRSLKNRLLRWPTIFSSRPPQSFQDFVARKQKQKLAPDDTMREPEKPTCQKSFLTKLPRHHPLVMKDGGSDEEMPEQLPIEEEPEETEAWAKPLTQLWQNRPPNFQAEKEYNKAMARLPPYCSVCMLFQTFQQTECAGQNIKSEPSTSEMRIRTKPLIPEMCFTTTGWSTDVNLTTPYLEEDGTSTLVTCRKCCVCVHSSCYGVPPEQATADWLCTRCAENALTEDCCLCPLRGGALQRANGERWVHVMCAVAVLEAKFVDIAGRRPVDISKVPFQRFRLKCVFCRKRKKRISGCCVQCSHGRCPTSFHVTCAQAAGLMMQPDDWPFVVFITCFRHKSPTQQEPVKPSQTELEVGQPVISKHKNGRYYQCEVIKRMKETFYEVNFDDGSFSSDLYPEDIVSHNCVQSGAPTAGEVVQVRWTDRQVYGATFIASHVYQMYEVEFEDGSQLIVKREDAYTLNEELPKRVKSRLSVASDTRFTEIFEDPEVKQEVKRQRVINSRYREDYIEPALYRAIME